MTLAASFLDELRLRTLLSGLIGRTVKLQKAGREFRACCPFHNEKTPSFYINDEKGFYHCFGCGAHGDAIRWLTDARGLGFMDAVKELAAQAGMEVPAPDPRAQEKAERAVGLYEVMDAAVAWFTEQLDGPEGHAARAYLVERGITEATKRKFGFGFAPDARGKLKVALKRFGNEKLVEAGLLIAPDDDKTGGGKEPYDRFRGRLMFPIRDARGRCIAFSGRIVGAGEPKYLNSPDTPLFDKGRTLFNIEKAAPASRSQGRIIVVEGQMDVVALDQAGFPETVAPLGTAVTETQISQLWRLSDKPLFCFDGDAAGQKAATRAARRALPLVQPGHTLAFLTLPKGRDPDDLIRMGGAAAFATLLAAPQSLVDKVWRAELEESDTFSPEGRAGLRQRLDQRAASIENPYIRAEYKKTFEDLFWEQFGWGKKRVEVSSELAESRKAKRKGFEYLLMRGILLGLCRYPDVLRDNHDLADELEITDPKLRRVYEALSLAVFEKPDIDEDMIEEMLSTSDTGPMEKRNIHKDLSFSFFKKHEPARGRADLRNVIGAVVAEREIEAALALANKNFREQVEGPEWEEQQRLRSERDRMKAGLVSWVEEATGGNGNQSDDAADDLAYGLGRA
ncbi:MAG: DNA primase [Sphingomonadaceae bacterium]|nr:DNA primase [Sphingomonadaceae bacterium]